MQKKVDKVVAWKKPKRGGFKLNIDGSSLGNLGMAGEGGIPWDANGQTKVGFATHYGVVSNTVAEGRALFNGLRMAQQMGLRNVMVESNSEIIVGWINARGYKFWYLWDFGEEVKMWFDELNYSICHNFIEANMVADFLAKQGANNNGWSFTSAEIGSGMLRGLLRMDC